jgi:hypothetical protein
MFIIQFIIKLVFFIINNIFSLFGYNTSENEKKYRKYIDYFLNVSNASNSVSNSNSVSSNIDNNNDNNNINDNIKNNNKYMDTN